MTKKAHLCRFQNHWHVVPMQSVSPVPLKFLIRIYSHKTSKPPCGTRWSSAIGLINIEDHMTILVPEEYVWSVYKYFLPTVVECNCLHMNHILASGTEHVIYERHRLTVPNKQYCHKKYAQCRGYMHRSEWTPVKELGVDQVLSMALGQ